MLRETARVSGAHDDGVGMFVNELTDLVNVSLGNDASVIDEENVRRHRLDFMKDVARHQDAPAGTAMLLVWVPLRELSLPFQSVVPVMLTAKVPTT